MFIDVTGFSNGEVRDVNFMQQLEIPSAYSILDNVMLVRVTGSVTAEVGSAFRFTGHIHSGFKSICNLCLLSIAGELTFDMDEIFSENPSLEDAWLFSGKTIDIMPAVLSNVLLNLPVKVLCKSDCMGLCPICGADLNLADCACDKLTIDPRWEGLRSLLNEKEV